MTAANRQLALEFLQAAFAGRVADAVARFHPDATWWVLGDPDRLKVSGLKDRVQAARLLGGFAKALPDGMQIEILGITAENERVAIEVEADGAWFDGRRYHNHYHFLIELRDGLILRVREYMDTLHLQQLTQG